MIRSLSYSLLMMLALLLPLSACRGRADDKPVPRRTAYPRPFAYQPVYSTLDSLPVRIDVNAHAVASVTPKRDGSVWIDVDYPMYHAKLLYTLTPVDRKSIGQVIDNRTERISLNIGSSAANVDEFVNGQGYSIVVASAPSVVSTPIQFIAAPDLPGGSGWVVSGAAFFSQAEPSWDVDSVAPMVQTLSRDVYHAMQALGQK